MRKHFYLHTSSLDIIEGWQRDACFERPSSYHPSELNKLHKYEWGRLATQENFYHILIGNLPQKECPWCEGTPEFKEIYSSDPFPILHCCMQCPKCGARGPIMNIADQILEGEVKEEVKNWVLCRFAQRKQWDYGLVNHYEEKLESEDKSCLG